MIRNKFRTMKSSSRDKYEKSLTFFFTFLVIFLQFLSFAVQIMYIDPVPFLQSINARIEKNFTKARKKSGDFSYLSIDEFFIVLNLFLIIWTSQQ